MWWIYSILSAAMQVLRNVIMKDLGHKLDEYINVWGRFTFLLPFAFIISYFTGIPQVKGEYWIYAVLAGFFVTISTISLSKAFKLSDISISTALWKINVIVLLILGIIFLNEKVTIISVLGILITVTGVYLLNIKKAKVSWWEPFIMLYKNKGLLFALLAGVLLAPVSIFF